MGQCGGHVDQVDNRSASPDRSRRGRQNRGNGHAGSPGTWEAPSSPSQVPARSDRPNKLQHDPGPGPGPRGRNTGEAAVSPSERNNRDETGDGESERFVVPSKRGNRPEGPRGGKETPFHGIAGGKHDRHAKVCPMSPQRRRIVRVSNYEMTSRMPSTGTSGSVGALAERSPGRPDRFFPGNVSLNGVWSITDDRLRSIALQAKLCVPEDPANAVSVRAIALPGHLFAASAQRRSCRVFLSG